MKYEILYDKDKSKYDKDKLKLSSFDMVAISTNMKSARKLIAGVGRNDVDYATSIRVGGKTVNCPFYSRWASMLNRCYSPRVHKLSPCYKGCTVDDRWHLFSGFRDWMEKHDWMGKVLDKDLKNLGNKVYSPDNCLFIPQSVNALLVARKTDSGKVSRRVQVHNKTGMYVVKRRGYDGKYTSKYFRDLRDAKEYSVVEHITHIHNLKDTYPYLSIYLDKLAKLVETGEYFINGK